MHVQSNMDQKSMSMLSAAEVQKRLGSPEELANRPKYIKTAGLFKVSKKSREENLKRQTMEMIVDLLRKDSDQFRGNQKVEDIETLIAKLEEKGFDNLLSPRGLKKSKKKDIHVIRQEKKDEILSQVIESLKKDLVTDTTNLLNPELFIPDKLDAEIGKPQRKEINVQHTPDWK